MKTTFIKKSYILLFIFISFLFSNVFGLSITKETALSNFQSLKIVNGKQNLNDTSNFVTSATYILRTKMLLDYKFGTAPIYKSYTGDKVLDSTLNTLDILGISYNKNNVNGGITTLELENLYTKVLGKAYNQTIDTNNNNIIDKGEMLLSLYNVYETIKAEKFASLEKKDTNNTTNNTTNTDNNTNNNNNTTTNTENTSQLLDEDINSLLEEMFNVLEE